VHSTPSYAALLPSLALCSAFHRRVHPPHSLTLVLCFSNVSTIGTFSYSAPEVLLGRECNEKADMYRYIFSPPWKPHSVTIEGRQT